MPENAFETFRQVILRDEGLQKQLRDLTNRSEFIERLIEIGVELGYEFTSPDIEEALRIARRTSIERAA